MEGDGTVRIWTKERKTTSAKREVIRFLVHIFLVLILLYGSLQVSESSMIFAIINRLKMLAEVMHTFKISIPALFAELKGIKSCVPNLLRSIRISFKKVMRLVISRVWRLGEAIWNWLEKDENSQQLKRKVLLSAAEHVEMNAAQYVGSMEMTPSVQTHAIESLETIAAQYLERDAVPSAQIHAVEGSSSQDMERGTLESMGILLSAQSLDLSLDVKLP